MRRDEVNVAVNLLVPFRLSTYAHNIRERARVLLDYTMDLWPEKTLPDAAVARYNKMSAKALKLLIGFRMPVVDFPTLQRIAKKPRLIDVLRATASVPFCGIELDWRFDHSRLDTEAAVQALRQLTWELGLDDGKATHEDLCAWLHDRMDKCPDLVYCDEKVLPSGDAAVVAYKGHLFKHTTTTDAFEVGAVHRFVDFPKGHMPLFES